MRAYCRGKASQNRWHCVLFIVAGATKTVLSMALGQEQAALQGGQAQASPGGQKQVMGHKRRSLLEAVEKREPSYTVGGNVKWYSCYGEQYGGSLKI